MKNYIDNESFDNSKISLSISNNFREVLLEYAGCVRFSDGQIVPTSGTHNSGFVDISGYTKLTACSQSLDKNNVQVAFYDYDKKYIQSLSIIGDSTGTI